LTKSVNDTALDDTAFNDTLMAAVKDEQPMWHREAPKRFWDPSRKLIKSIRDHQAICQSRAPFKAIRKKICSIRYRFWSAVSGAEIPQSVVLGGGFFIPHPNGVVIHNHAKIGINCMLFQQVTLAGAVELGDHVDIGAGAKLLGPLKVGNNAVIGANAVVLGDVEAGTTVVGIPARVVKRATK